MAGEAVISLRCEIWQQPEVLAIAEQLDLSKYDAVGRLAHIWGWAVKHTAAGLIAGLTARTVDGLVQLPGFARAMESVGWLEFTDEGIAFPGWDKWLSRTARTRAEASARKARSRSTPKPAFRPAPPATAPVATPQPAEPVTPQVPTETPQVAAATSQTPAQTPRVPASPPPEQPANTANPATAAKPLSEGSVFAPLELDDLKDVARLRRWFDWQLTQPAPVCIDSEVDWLNVVAAAVRAVKHGNKPLRMFASIVGRKLWKNIDTTDIDKARSWLREYARQRAQREQREQQPRESQTTARSSPPDQSAPAGMAFPDLIRECQSRILRRA